MKKRVEAGLFPDLKGRIYTQLFFTLPDNFLIKRVILLTKMA
jgi:hypothetical protein